MSIGSLATTLQGSNPTLLQGGGGIPLQGSGQPAQLLQPASTGIALTNPNQSGIPLNPAAAPKSTPSPQAGGGGGGSTTSSGSTTGFGNLDQPEYLAGIQQEYGGQLAADARQATANDASYGTNKNLVEAQYGANANQVNQQAEDSMNTLSTQASGIDAGRRLSLAELADEIHGQNQALGNELGTVGAGSSSALETGQDALAKVQNTGRADIEQNAGSQVANISAEKQAVTDQQKTQLDALGVWRQQQLAQIMQLYQQNQNAIDSAMQTAEGEEKARLAEFGVSLQQGVSAALQALDKQVQDGVTNITNYQVGNAPTIKAPVPLATPTPVSAPTLSPFNVGNSGQSNTTATPVGGSLFTRNNQQ